MAAKAPLSLDKTPPHDYEPEGRYDWSNLSLDIIGRIYGTDKSSLDHGYCDTYEKYFRELRGKPVNLIEIGVACGASLKMWHRYFTRGYIQGIDIRPECHGLCKGYPSIAIDILDATKTNLSITSGWDIIIDDGSHVSQDIVDAFGLHWPILKPGGYYCIEDTLCVRNANYRTPLQPDRSRYDPAHYDALMSLLTTECDQGNGVEWIHHYRQLTIIRKKPDA